MPLMNELAVRSMEIAAKDSHIQTAEGMLWRSPPVVCVLLHSETGCISSVVAVSDIQ